VRGEERPFPLERSGTGQKGALPHAGRSRESPFGGGGDGGNKGINLLPTFTATLIALAKNLTTTPPSKWLPSRLSRRRRKKWEAGGTGWARARPASSAITSTRRRGAPISQASPRGLAAFFAATSREGDASIILGRSCFFSLPGEPPSARWLVHLFALSLSTLGTRAIARSSLPQTSHGENLRRGGKKCFLPSLPPSVVLPPPSAIALLSG